ncbi:hypothetical protein V8G54_009806 [Vigna mungo]|uniref:Uncharacterized protein n=1 Tax=Vigna mungo TaxID=3915 RepID=A0AAQ3S2G8_VIGMU
MFCVAAYSVPIVGIGLHDLQNCFSTLYSITRQGVTEYTSSYLIPEIFVSMAISLASLVLQVKEGFVGVVEGVGVFEEEEVEIEFANKVKRSLRFGGMRLEEVKEGGGEVFGVGEGEGERSEVEEGGVEEGVKRVGEDDGEERWRENHDGVSVVVAML